MLIAGRPRRTIWPTADGAVEIIDQTRLPHAVEIIRLASAADAVTAIADMQVRGAPLIGVTAAWGLALALAQDASDLGLEQRRRRAASLPPHGGQPGLGDRAVEPGCRRAPARLTRASGPRGGGEDGGGGRRRLSRDRRAWRGADRGGVSPQGRGPGQHPDPLQRRLAGDGGLGNGPGADLRRPGARRRHARLGGRDAAAKPGRRLDRVRTRTARR